MNDVLLTAYALNKEMNPLLTVVCLAAALVMVKLSTVTKMTSLKMDRLSQLDGLRGILAMAVFFHHFAIFYQWRHGGAWLAVKSQYYNLLGSFGVIGFFVITGFLFFAKIKAVRGHMDLNRFFLGRLFRLYPVWLFSVLAMYFLALWSTHFVVKDDLITPLNRLFIFQSVTINNVHDSPLFNASVQWTLAYEWFFYFLIPPLAWLWSRFGLSTWFVFYLTILTLWAKCTPFEIPIVTLNSALMAPFALGGLISELSRLDFMRSRAKQVSVTVVLIILCTVFFAAFSTANSLAGYLLLSCAILPICAGNDIFGFLRWRPLVFLGEISYDIYLLHGITLQILFRVIFRNYLERAFTDWQIFLCMLLATAGVVAVSAVVHLFVEKPAMRLLSKIYGIDRTQELAAP